MRLIATLRTGDWLDRTRALAYRRLLILASGVMLAGWLLASRDGIDAAGKPIGTDFLSFWSAARLALAGTPDGAYNRLVHHAAETAAFGRDTGYAAFFYPPPFLLMCLMFGLVPYFVALALWSGLTGAALALALRSLVARVPGGWWSLIAFPALLVNLGHGQNGFLTAALLGGGLLAIRRHPILSGVLLGSLVIKPHLALLVPLALLSRREWRVMTVAALTAAAWCVLASVAFGPGIWRAFAAAAPLARGTLENGWVEPYKMVSLFAAVRLNGGSVALSYAAQVLLNLVAAVSVLAGGGRRIEADAGLIVAAGLLASPFVLDYDMVLLALPLAGIAGAGTRHGFLPWEKTVLAYAFVAPLVGRQVAATTGVPIDLLAIGSVWVLTVRRAFLPSHHRHAAVDVDRLPGDVAGLAAGEIGHRRADVLA